MKTSHFVFSHGRASFAFHQTLHDDHCATKVFDPSSSIPARAIENFAEKCPGEVSRLSLCYLSR